MRQSKTLGLLLFALTLLPLSARAQTTPRQVTKVLSSATCSGAVGSGCAAIGTVGAGTVGIEIEGASSFSGTLAPECTIAGNTWVAMRMTPPGSTTAVTSATAAGTWQANAAGCAQVRVRFSSYTSGNARVTLLTAPAGGASSSAAGGSGGEVTNAGVFAVQVDAAIPAGNNNIGDVDVASIAAGNNNIGDVDVASIAAGNNNIGDVDVASIAAGDNNIGNVDILAASGAFASGSISSGAIASGAIASGAVASGAYASGAFAAGAGADGWDTTLGTTTQAKSTATDTTSVSVISALKQISYSTQQAETLLTTATATNSLKRILSAGATEDETEVKATAGTLAGFACTNNHASANAHIKFVQLTAANTTPGTSTVWFSHMLPFGGGIVDSTIEAAFTPALTAYVVLGEADTAVDEVAANDIQCSIRYR